MELKNISELPIDIQKQIKGQYLTNSINLYGISTTEINGQKYIDDHYTDKTKLTEMDDFKALKQGCETWLVGERYPMRICLNPTRVNNTVVIKKIIAITLRAVKTETIFGKVIMLIYLKRHWKDYLEFMWCGMQNVYYPEVKFYSQPVREVYSVIKDERIRDVITL